MTDYALWTDNTQLAAKAASTMSGHAGSDGWVMPATGTLIADDISSLAAGPYNAFNHTGSTNLDVTIANGEAMISGSPTARDTSTTYTLAASTSGQTVYVGYEPATNAGVVIGKSGDFTADARKIPIWEFDTQSSSVSSATDRRVIDETITVRNTRYETSDGSGTTVDDASMLAGVGPSSYARLGQSETVSAQWTLNSGLNMANSTISDVNSVDSGDTSAALLLNAGLADISVQTGGGGSGVARVYDNANSQPIADFNEGGGVKFPNGDLETRGGWMVDSDTPRSIYVGTSFPSGAENGDFLFEPQ